MYVLTEQVRPKVHLIQVNYLEGIQCKVVGCYFCPFFIFIQWFSCYPPPQSRVLQFFQTFKWNHPHQPKCHTICQHFNAFFVIKIAVLMSERKMARCTNTHKHISEWPLNKITTLRLWWYVQKRETIIWQPNPANFAVFWTSRKWWWCHSTCVVLPW